MIKLIMIKIITVYQYVMSPILGSNCRFYPSCSTYAKEAINHYGVITGIWMSIKRLAKCHPFHQGGIDIVEVHK